MELLVDFNMVEADGRIAADISSQQASSLLPGSEVVIDDGEGTRCRAVVDEIDPDGRYVMVVPIDGTVEPSDLGPSASDSPAR